MPSTPLGFPYPALGDGPPDVPHWMQLLAEAIDTFISEPDWHVVGSGGGEPGFDSGWGEGTPHKCMFRKDLGDLVTLSGGVSGGNRGAPAFALPVAYRPADGNLRFPCQSSDGVVTVIEIESATGKVTPDPDGAGTYGGIVYLSGISFRSV